MIKKIAKKKLSREYWFILAVRAVKYASVGLLGMGIDTTSYFMFNSIGVEHRISRFISYWLSATSNWYFNRNFTFKREDKNPPIAELFRFYAMAVGSFFINFGFYFVATTYIDFFQKYKTLAFFLGIAIAFLYNFILANLFVYKINSINTLPEKREEH